MGCVGALVIDVGSMCGGVVERACTRVIGIEAVDVAIVGIGGRVPEVLNAGAGVVSVERQIFFGGVTVGIISVTSNLVCRVFIITVHGCHGHGNFQDDFL